MKKGMVVFRNLILFLAAGVVCGLLSMTLVYMLPVNEKSENIRESMEVFEAEGWYPVLPYMESFTKYGVYADEPGRLDNFTDEIMISTAADSVDGEWLYHAMYVKGYSYYWHGYTIILRPLLLLMNYGEIRKLNAILQVFLIGVLALLLYKRKGVLWSFWAVTIYALLVPAALGMSLQFSWVFYIGIIGTVVLLRWEGFFKKNYRIYYLFLIIGVLTSFFDLLTYPLFTWGIPMVIWIALDGREGEKHRLKDVVVCGLCWILGYGGMWVGKCLLASLILHSNVIETALYEVAYRSGLGSQEETTSYLNILLENARKLIGVQGLVLSLGWGICIVFGLVKARGRVVVDKCLSFTLISISTFAWYFVLQEHTHMHQWFTYRIYAVFFGALLAALISAVESGNDAIDIVRPLAMKLALAVALALALFVTLQYKTELWYHNGNYTARQVALGEGMWAEEIITPRYNEIRKINLGIGAEAGDKGEFRIEIYSEEGLIYQKNIPIAEVQESTFYELPINIDTKGNRIRMRVSATDCEDSGAYILVTEGEMPLPECSELTLDGETLGGQMTQGFTYWWFYGKKECVNYFFNSAGTLLLLFFDILCVINIIWRKPNTLRLVKGKNL